MDGALHHEVDRGEGREVEGVAEAGDREPAGRGHHDHVAGGGTSFLCSHVLESAERLCNRMAIINEGKVLAAGAIDDLKLDGESLEDVFIRLVGHTIEEAEQIAGTDAEEE